jgi:hypothetical protein
LRKDPARTRALNWNLPANHHPSTVADLNRCGWSTYQDSLQSLSGSEGAEQRTHSDRAETLISDTDTDTRLLAYSYYGRSKLFGRRNDAIARLCNGRLGHENGGHCYTGEGAPSGHLAERA